MNSLQQISQPTIWQRIQAFWTALGLEKNSLPIDPEILQGEPGWWYVYESTTGQLTYLESERDLDMWLEEAYRSR